MTTSSPAGPARARQPLWIRGIERLTLVLAGATGLAIVLMGLNVIADVGMRNLFGEAILGTNELVSFLWMPAIAYLGLAFAQYRGEHIGVTLLVDHASPQGKRILGVFAEVLAVVLATWLLYLCWNELSSSFERGESATILEWLPLWPGRAFLVVSYAAVVLAAVARLYQLLWQRDPQAEPPSALDEGILFRD